MAPVIATKKFRVLVVDDSAFMRKVLETIFNADPQLQVVGHAKDGREAVALAESLKPDVITMDINMPHVDGLQATAEIMTTNPRPIVVVSSESREGASSTLRALELGAIEFVAKPSSGIDLDMQSVREELLRKVRMAAKVRVVRTASRIANTLRNAPPATAETAQASRLSQPVRSYPAPTSNSGLDQRFPVVVLGASTGGPATVMRLAPGFTARFPSRRNSRSAHARGLHHAVHRAARRIHQHPRERSRAQRIAAPRRSLRLPRRTPRPHHAHRPMQLDASSGRINGYLPNIDVTMESAASFAGAMSIGAILTGMGNDGTAGCLAIKRAGGFVLAQNEETCVIFGMPSEAIKAGAVNEILGIDDIYSAIEKRVIAIARPIAAGVR